MRIFLLILPILAELLVDDVSSCSLAVVVIVCTVSSAEVERLAEDVGEAGLGRCSSEGRGTAVLVSAPLK